jgi:hypothetical protein
MTTIGYKDIENVLLNISDPNTWSTITWVPWVSSPKINAATSVYNEQWWGDGLGIAWWSTSCSWTPWVWTIAWSAWDINLPDWTVISVSSWSASVTAPTYIYVNTEDWTVSSTVNSYDAVWENKIMICAAFPNSWKNVTFKAFGCADQNSLTTWADIAAWTIVASNIASETITASQIASWTITANEIAWNTITASEIASGAVTAAKIDVSQLSAIAADLWSITAGDITWVTITASNGTSSIKLDPNNWRIIIQRNGSQVWYINWINNSTAWNCLWINGSNVWVTWTLWCLGKLRIPVWNDLY